MIVAQPFYKAPPGFSLVDIWYEIDDAYGPTEVLRYENNVGEKIIVKRNSLRIISVDWRLTQKYWSRQVSDLFPALHLSPTNLKVVPGAKLIILAEFFFAKAIFQGVYVPIITDMREEYNEALSQNRIWKARWIRVRGTYSFFAAIGVDRAFSFVSFFIKAWKSVN